MTEIKDITPTPKIDDGKYVKGFNFNNTLNDPITIAFSFNIDPKRKTGDIFPTVRGQGRAKSDKIVIPPKTNKSFKLTQALKVPDNLPLRITWYQNDNTEVHQDILNYVDFETRFETSDYPIWRILDDNGYIYVNFLWSEYGGGTPFIMLEMLK